MTKDEALGLALEALEKSVATCFDRYAHEQVMSRPEHFINQAITAIKQALAAPVQEPVGYITQARCFVHLHECTEAEAKLYGWKALYTTPPAQPAPVQEPVAWGIIASNTGRICQVELDADEIEGHNPKHIVPLYTTPPAQPAPVQEPVAWLDPEGDEYCNVITASWKRKLQAMSTRLEHDHAAKHTVPVYTTPPAQPAPVQEPDLAKAYREELDKLSQRNYELRMENAELKATPPAAQRQWVDLKDEEMREFDVDPIEAKLMIAKLKEKNTP